MKGVTKSSVKQGSEWCVARAEQLGDAYWRRELGWYKGISLLEIHKESAFALNMYRNH